MRNSVHCNFQLSSNDPIECDNEFRRQTKDNKVPSNNDIRGKEASAQQQQRSSASPTSNIWLRLIEDEENIGKNIFNFFPLAALYITTIGPLSIVHIIRSPLAMIKAPDPQTLDPKPSSSHLFTPLRTI